MMKSEIIEIIKGIFEDSTLDKDVPYCAELMEGDCIEKISDFILKNYVKKSDNESLASEA